MVTRPTTSTRGEAAPDGAALADRAASRLRIERLPGLPGSRAVVGGLLVAVAGVGTLATWQQASGPPGHTYAVAVRPILPGETVTPEHVRLAPVDLPTEVASAAFPDVGDVAERVALAPIGAGELLQSSQLSDPGPGAPVAELSLALERDRAVDGRLRSGDLIDVFVTWDDRTDAVAEGVRVVSASDGGPGFGAASRITVTLALDVTERRADLVHAARAGDVTLVRSTHAQPAGAG